MLEIPLLVLVLHIGFNAALYYSDYNRNPLIPSARFINSRRTRQLWDSDLPLSSRGITNSDSEESDSEYSSSEESSYRSGQPLQGLSYQKRNHYLRDNSRPDNDLSLEYSPTGTIGSEYVDSLLSSSSVLHRRDSNFRGPYLKHGPSNLRQSQNRKYYRKENNDLGLEASSIDEDVSPTEEDSSYLRSLSSFVVKPNNRRVKNRKYYRKGNNLSLEPIDKSDLDEDTDNSLSISRARNLDEIEPSNGRQNRKNYKNHKSNDSPNQKYQRKNNDNVGLEASLVDKLFPDDDNTGHLAVLRLSSLEDLNLKSPQLRRREKQHNNRQNNHRNFLRLSPNDKLTLDEDTASDLSELLSDTLDELKLEPVNLRSPGSSNNKYSRRANVGASLDSSSNDRLSSNKNNLRNLSVLRLGSLDNLNVESSRLRYREPSNRRRNTEKTDGQRQENDKALKKLFDDNDNFASDLSVLQSTNLDSLSLKPSLLKNPDEYQSKQQDTTDTLHLEFPWNNQLSPDNNKKNDQAVLRELKSQLSSREQIDNAEDTSYILHLEYPWNDQLTPNEDKTSGLRSQSQLSSREQIDNAEDTSYILNLEYPWNDQLSPGDDKSSNLLTLSDLRSQSRLRSQEQKDRANDINVALHLEYPWKDPLSPDGNENNNLSALRGRKPQLRSQAQKDNANILPLEFPWNDQLSPNEGKTGGLRSQSRSNSQTDSRQDRDPKVYELKLEYPWNGRRSLDKETSSKQTVTHSAGPLNQYPFLRNQNKHNNYYTQSYKDAGLLDNVKDSPTESYLRKSNSRLNDNQSLRVLSIARQGLKNDTGVSTDSNKGINGFSSLPLDRRPHARLRTQGEHTPLYLSRRANYYSPLVTTTSRPNYVVSLLRRAGDKSDRKTYITIL